MNYLIEIDKLILYFCSITIKNRLFDIIMPVLSNINNHGEVWILITLCLILNKNKKVKQLGYYMLGALILGYFISDICLKHIVHRSRPIKDLIDYKFLVEIPKSYSFPSGHTTSSFAAAGVLLLKNAKYKYLALILAIFISFSRMYVHVHNPSDVFVGMLVGLLSAELIVVFLDKYFNTKNNKELTKQ